MTKIFRGLRIIELGKFPAKLFVALFVTLLFHSQATAHGDLDLQISELGTLIDAQPDNATLYLKRGELYRRHMQWERAVKDFQYAEKYGITSDELSYYRGRLQREAGHYDLAQSYLNEALQSKPDHIDALIERAKIPSWPAPQAVQDLNKAIRLSPTPSPDMYLFRAQLTASMGAGHLPTMLLGLRAGLQRLGPLAALIDFGVSECERNKMWQDALELTAMLPKIVRNSPAWLVREGELNTRLENFDRAEELFHQAQVKIDSLPAARKNTSATLAQQQKINEAKQNLKKVGVK